MYLYWCNVMEKNSAPSSFERNQFETLFRSEVLSLFLFKKRKWFINAQESLLSVHFWKEVIPLIEITLQTSSVITGWGWIIRFHDSNLYIELFYNIWYYVIVIKLLIFLLSLLFHCLVYFTRSLNILCAVVFQYIVFYVC